jgi:Matrixin
MAACGGSQPSAPTAPPTPDTSVAAGTTLSVASGETGQPVAGAHVVVSGRPYDTDASGQVTLADRVPYGSLVDVTAPNFLDRQTLLRKNGARRFVLWPRSTPWGLNEAYTAQLVYTYGSADAPAVGSSPLERLRQGTKEVVVVVTDEIRQNGRVNEAHQIAVGHINEALAGKVTYVLSPTKPTTGVIIEASVDPADAVCQDRVLGYALLSYQSGEIIGGKMIYCRIEKTDAALISHELGHTTGLNHSSDSRDLMYPFITGVERLTRAESLSLNMLFERPAGNRFQDNDRDASAAASGTRTIICR